MPSPRRRNDEDDEVFLDPDPAEEGLPKRSELNFEPTSLREVTRDGTFLEAWES